MIMSLIIRALHNSNVHELFKLVRPLMCDTTALGAAIAAGRAEGIRKWDVRSNIAVPSDSFFPSISDNGNFNLLHIFELT